MLAILQCALRRVGGLLRVGQSDVAASSSTMCLLFCGLLCQVRFAAHEADLLGHVPAVDTLKGLCFDQ